MSDDLLQKAVQRLVQKEPGWQKFVQPEPRGAKPAEVGRSASPAASGSGGGGGGTLDELDYSQREYWPVINKVSTDGLFTLQIKPIKSILLSDGSRATFKQPI